MACPVTPLSCLDPTVLFAGIYNSNCGGFADPSKYSAERLVFNSMFIEQINNYGVDVNFYVNGFNLAQCNILYGEHPTQEYSPPFVVRAMLELEESVSLTRYGMESDDELVMYIAIDSFTDAFIQYLVTETGLAVLTEAGKYVLAENSFHEEHGQRIEPKSDDLVEITALGCDRPGTRGAKIFRITEVLDQSVSSGINPLMGHYVWKITAKRYEPSSETNAPQELGNDQVYDNLFSGKLSSVDFLSLSSLEKVYDYDVDTISHDEVYDMSKNDTDVYGTYY